MMNIGIIDAGIGNVVSIKNALFSIGFDPVIVNNSKEIDKFSHLILPGVGAFDSGMKRLNEGEFSAAICNFRNQGKPILGICLGMQLFFERSEEGITPGFNFFKGDIKRIKSDSKLRIPNTGWHELKVLKPSQILSGVNELRMYHNHSYAFQMPESNFSFAVLDLEESIVVGVQHENVFGVQFHPEKSHSSGIKILKNFCEINV